MLSTSHWAWGEPNDQGWGEDCAILDIAAGTWSDVDCREPHPFACEGGAPTPSPPPPLPPPPFPPPPFP